MDSDQHHEEEIRFAADDGAIGGVLALPATPPAAAVVLLPDVRGISPLYRRLAGRLADTGLATLVLDIYSREGPPDLPDMEAVFRCIAQLPDARVLGDVAAALRHLAERPETRDHRIGVAGFCLGGQFALMASCRDPAPHACVSFYGMLRYDDRPPHKPASPLDLAPALACPFLGLFGADDRLVTPADRALLESILTEKRKRFSLHVFGGAGHAFLNDTRPDDFRPEAARLAWQIGTSFLHSTLVDASSASTSEQ